MLNKFSFSFPFSTLKFFLEGPTVVAPIYCCCQGVSLEFAENVTKTHSPIVTVMLVTFDFCVWQKWSTCDVTSDDVTVMQW